MLLRARAPPTFDQLEPYSDAFRFESRRKAASADR